MFSARLVARLAPRSTSFATRALSTATRRAFTSPLKPVSITSQLPKLFSTSRPQFDASSQELAAKLSNELQLETSDDAQKAMLTEDEISSFLARNDWQLVDTEGEQLIKLTKKHEDELITVQFTVADFPPPYGEEDEMDEALLDEEEIDAQSGGANSKGAISQGRTSGGNIKVGQNDKVAPGNREELLDEEDDHAGSQQGFPASISVSITRDGKQNALRFELVAEDGDIRIESITPLPSAEATEVAPGYPGAEKYWAGPPFQQLDEELQSIFENYLAERGINSDLATFVPDYIDNKEQKEYVSWLKNVEAFVN